MPEKIQIMGENMFYELRLWWEEAMMVCCQKENWACINVAHAEKRVVDINPISEMTGDIGMKEHDIVVKGTRCFCHITMGACNINEEGEESHSKEGEDGPEVENTKEDQTQ